MNVKSDSEIRGAYEEMMESMSRLVRSRNAASAILWSDIYGWIEPGHSAWKADFCGILAQKIASGYNPAANNPSYYQEIQIGYAFGKSIDELGEYWKELIREEKAFRLRLLLGWLKVYYEVIMPYVKNEMVDWFSEAGQGHPELTPTLKPYREHRIGIKTTMQIIETALDIWSLQNKNDHEDM